MRNPLHNALRHPLRWTAALLAGLLFAGNACCADNHASTLVLGFAVKSFLDVDVKDAHAAMSIWTKELASGVGFVAESRLYDDFDQMLTDFRKGALSIAILPPLDYIRKEPSLKATLGYIGIVDGKTTQRYVVLTPADKGHHIASLKGSRLAHVHNDEVGLLFLNTLLLKNRQPETDRFFTSVQRKSKSSQAIHAVYFGTADVCVTTERSFNNMNELNPQIGKKLKAIAVSPELLRDVSVYSPRTPIRLQQQVDARAHVLRETPRGRQVLTLFQCSDFKKMREDDLVQTRKLYHEYLALKGKRTKGMPQ